MTTFIDEQTNASASGLRVLKDPSDPRWSWQTVNYLQAIWKSLDLDYNRYIETWAEAEEHKVWEKVPYDNPFGTKEEMLKELKLADDKQAQRRMKAQPIANRVRRKYGHGGDRRSEDFQPDDGKVEKKYGNDPDYLLGRVLQKRPDVFDRYTSGEIPTARAAAIEAGIPYVQPMKTLTLSDNVERVADRIKSHYSPEQLQRIRERLDATD